MSETAPRRAGAPLTALMVLLGVWVLARAVLWQSPFPVPLPELGLPGFAGAVPVGKQDKVTTDLTPSERPAEISELGLVSERPPRIAAASITVPLTVNRAGPLSANASRLQANHQLLFAAGMAYAPSVEEFRRLVAGRHIGVPSPARPVMAAASGWPPPSSGGAGSNDRKASRWSFDGWALWRDGSRQSAAAAAPSPSYGQSQAGAVLRYRIAPEIGQSPQAFVRATRSLVSRPESEVAAGLSARPIAALPLRAHGEIRMTERPSGQEIRPAAFVATEIPPQDLPLGLRADVYAQGGYVGGDFATAFADGQVKIDRDVARFDLGTLRAGAGVWGGAQKGAARLDAGPSVALALDKTPVPARLSVDYRVRVTGDARPGSGVAVTLTTGF
ncbi:hypothetical protein ACFCW2_02360 [Qipengyuania sp. DSG2-2]|uniref:hypothetical protein n=1 Tax=Qipengyuania sp. DGS2-2 TaxID=3349631 RepID=UPI0036D3F712